MDASKGSFAMAQIVEVFKETGEKLESCVETAETSAAKESFPILNRIMDCKAFLKGPETVQKKKRSRSSVDHKGNRKKRRMRWWRSGKSNGKNDSHT